MLTIEMNLNQPVELVKLVDRLQRIEKAFADHFVSVKVDYKYETSSTFLSLVIEEKMGLKELKEKAISINPYDAEGMN